MAHAPKPTCVICRSLFPIGFLISAFMCNSPFMVAEHERDGADAPGSRRTAWLCGRQAMLGRPAAPGSREPRLNGARASDFGMASSALALAKLPVCTTQAKRVFR